jgi:alginate O-acetyltransferase complex protein AlgI
MVFSSLLFIFAFLPVVLLLFFTVRKELRFPLLLLSSLLFYFIGENYLIWVMLTTTLIDYLCGIMISGGFRNKGIKKGISGEQKTLNQKIWLVVSITSNLALLGYFKYYNFFTDNIIGVAESLGLMSNAATFFTRVSLPLGISFYTFQSMSYTIDVYRGHVNANRNPVNFAMFVTLFPQLVAGPIVRYSDVEAQIKNHSVKLDDFVEGIKRFILGLAKKVLIANPLAFVVDDIYSLSANDLSPVIAWVGILAYALQLYFDFSGYSCMAIGLGKMFGFTFPENFNYPYISTSIKEFWRRWHMTLSTWFRDYLYIPLGGNSKSGWRTYLNLFIVFLLCGFWHGASWNFIIFGAFHGAFMALERTKFGKTLKKLPIMIQHFYFVVVILTSFVIFRSENLLKAKDMLLYMFGKSWITDKSVFSYLSVEAIVTFIAGMVFILPVMPALQKFAQHIPTGLKPVAQTGYFLVILLLFLLSIKSLVLGSFNPFIYYRF